jgi:hypothetical protein
MEGRDQWQSWLTKGASSRVDAMIMIDGIHQHSVARLRRTAS